MHAQSAVVTPRLFTESELDFLAEALGEAADQYEMYAAKFSRLHVEQLAEKFLHKALQARAMQLEIEAR